MWELIDNVDWGDDTTRFVDYAGGDFALRPGADVPACWSAIPFHEIGLHTSERRPELPER
jgi:hypothetical protein